MTRFRIFLLFLGLALSGCATAPDSLRKVERGETIHLTQAISTVASRGIGVRSEEGALPGLYTAEREDDEGTYFYGAGRPIWSTNEMLQKTPRLHAGGIYVPRDPGRAPQFFYLIEMEIHTVESIDRLVQERIAMSSAMPATSPGIGVGANVVGNVVGGVLIQAIIESGVGKIVKFPPIEDAGVRDKILKARRAS